MAPCKICPTCGLHNETGALSCKECDTDLSSTKIVNEEIAVDCQRAKELQQEEQQEEEQQEEEQQEEEQQEEVQQQEQQDNTLTIHKTCPGCGKRNPPQARKCQYCGDDISDIIATAGDDLVETHYELRSLDGDYSFQVPCGCSMVGREYEMREYLAAKPFVSRMHAKLVVEDGKLFIENQSSTNYTFVNNIKIPSGRTLLKTGDEISLGGITVNGIRQSEAAYFIVGTAL